VEVHGVGDQVLVGGTAVAEDPVEVALVDFLAGQGGGQLSAGARLAYILEEALEDVAGTELTDEDDHREQDESGEKHFLVLAEPVERIKGHYQSSVTATALTEEPAAGLDTRRARIVWVRGGLSSK